MPDFTIKGNPGEIRSRGQTCADKGKFFDQTGDALTKIDTQGWIGRAADNFRDAHDREPNRWYEAGTGFRAAGNALIDYASALETAQQNAATAKSEYERGEGVTTQAKSDYAEYSSRFDRARSDALAGGMTYPYTKDPFTDPGAEIRSGALEMFETAKSNLKIAAGRCAREVRIGCKDAPEKRNWFESGLAFVGGIFEGAGEAVWDLVKMGYNMGPLHDIIELATGDLTAEELAAQQSMMLEDAEALWQALKTDPLEFGKQLGKGLLDWDTWADDPARAIGHLVPDIVAGVLTGGTGTVATRGIKGGADALDALSDIAGAARGLRGLDDLGDLKSVDNGLDGLGDLNKLDEIPTGREYQMMDGSVHKTDFAPEQIGSNRATIDGVLDQHGTDRDSMISLVNKPTSQLTDIEAQLLRDVRDDLPRPEADTMMQKVIGQPSFDKDGNLVQSGADDYILGNKSGFDVTQVRGSVAIADDVSHLGTPEEIRRGLRLDYSGTPFREGDPGTHVLRFRADNPAGFEVPRNSSMGGSTKFDTWTDPFTGNGFTKATDDLVPELYANNVTMRPGAEMWEILDNGNQRLVAVLDKSGDWMPQGN